jgi:hypothetical protein
MMLIEAPAPATVDPDIDDRTLHAHVVALALKERALRADFILSLGVFEERRLHLKAGYPTLFAWLTDHLHFSRASAFRRATAAQLCRRMPAVAAYLREGRLSLTKLCHLKYSLAPENCLALLEQAASLTEKEVELLALQLHPGAGAGAGAGATRDTIRPLSAVPKPSLSNAESQGELFAAAPTPSPQPAPQASPTPPTVALPEEPPAVPPPTPAPVRHLVRMTVGPEFMKLLDEVRGALSHSHPGASLEVLLGECMKLALVTRHARTRAQTPRPRATSGDPPPTTKGSRYLPAHLRREVWRRDAGRCTFVSEDGVRCQATRRLEIHHDIPFAMGGPTHAGNCRLMCKGHNDLIARRDFGDAHMNRFTNFAMSSTGGTDDRRPRDEHHREEAWIR